MITTERLAEIEIAPREASIFKAESKELCAAYRKYVSGNQGNGMITTERLAEIEIAPREASIFKAESKELCAAYRAIMF